MKNLHRLLAIGYRLLAIGYWLFLAQSAAQTPPGQYTLKYLAWDSNVQGGTVLVRTNPAFAPVKVFATTTNIAAITDLSYGATYYLSVTNAGGASTNYIWPHPREDYFATMNFSLASPAGAKFWLPETLRTLTNSPAPAQFVGCAAWASNNITPYIYPQ